jgi:hypothetical protein
MALAGGRQIDYQGRNYEWVVGRSGVDFRIVIQSREIRGQLLIAWHPVYWVGELNEAHGNYYMRSRISPLLLKNLLADAFRHGWRPNQKGLPPFQLGAPSGPWKDPLCTLNCIDALWSLLNAIRQDAAWRRRLIAHSPGTFTPLTTEDIRLGDSVLEGPVASVSPLAIHVRTRDYHGDATPHLAIRSLVWNWDVLLEDISDWHPGW